MTIQRPNNILGLTIRLLGLWFRKLFPLVVIVIMLALLAYALLPRGESIHVATFNIQDYPRDASQATAAVELIDSMEIDVLGVQELIEPDTFDKNIGLYLGESWKVVHVDQEVKRRVALVYDDSSMQLVETNTHEDTAVIPGARATLEATFRTDRRYDEDRRLRIFVVHLKAHSDGETIRKQQLNALRPIVEDAIESGDDVVLLGDFNSTEDNDRRRLAAFADSTGLDWSTETLECTAYWDRKTDCAGSALDHIFISTPPQAVDVHGGCDTVGCDSRSECPTYVDRISDHCPVSSTL